MGFESQRPVMRRVDQNILVGDRGSLETILLKSHTPISSFFKETLMGSRRRSNQFMTQKVPYIHS